MKFIVRRVSVEGYQKPVAEIVFEDADGIQRRTAIVAMEGISDTMELHVCSLGEEDDFWIFPLADLEIALNEARSCLLKVGQSQ